MAKKPTRDEKIAKAVRLYAKYGTANKVQNHFPDLSVRTVQRMIKEGRERGL